jgi:hypothetical protein
VVELETLLAGAAAASPGKRIEYRDPIATHGLAAIAPMRQWLGDDRLAAFAVRTLIAIAKDQTHRLAVIEVLRSIDLSTASPIAVDDAADALRTLMPSGPTGTPTARAEALDHGPITESIAHTRSNCWLRRVPRLDLTGFAKSDASISQSKHWSFGRNI